MRVDLFLEKRIHRVIRGRENPDDVFRDAFQCHQQLTDGILPQPVGFVDDDGPSAFGPDASTTAGPFDFANPLRCAMLRVDFVDAPEPPCKPNRPQSAESVRVSGPKPGFRGQPTRPRALFAKWRAQRRRRLLGATLDVAQR